MTILDWICCSIAVTLAFAGVALAELAPMRLVALVTAGYALLMWVAIPFLEAIRR